MLVEAEGDCRETKPFFFLWQKLSFAWIHLVNILGFKLDEKAPFIWPSVSVQYFLAEQGCCGVYARQTSTTHLAIGQVDSRQGPYGCWCFGAGRARRSSDSSETPIGLVIEHVEAIVKTRHVVGVCFCFWKWGKSNLMREPEARLNESPQFRWAQSKLLLVFATAIVCGYQCLSRVGTTSNGHQNSKCVVHPTTSTLCDDLQFRFQKFSSHSLVGDVIDTLCIIWRFR